MPGKKYASIKKPAMYEDLKQKGLSKSSAAAISNAAAAGTLKRGGKKRVAAKKKGGGLANFGNKRAAPFGAGGKRKRSSTKTATGQQKPKKNAKGY